ncbi:uncharacterized protein LOC131004129 [Salvia miltiorrhiza]|uniref:uncharacterized protein LOC131004129 n=1 Tax=Salvia miltiorrhiza TaxID=226208 RepID=UPI0025AD2806|nr:uncharacterized protein LOC131004129 [Salvia miltiorrhiza]
MSVDDDTITAMRVIEIGAFLYIKRPTTLEMLRCLWQHVARENARAMRERERLMAANHVTPPRGIEFREMTHHLEENPSSVGPNNLFAIAAREKGKFKKGYYHKGRQVEEEYNSDNNVSAHGKVKRKVCTEWTQELHEKFMDAVEQLGEGRCFPKEILELMNVPGLTRMQVASHLQKCRNDNWRSPVERKLTLGTHPMSSDGEGSHQKPRRFGSMPRVEKAPSDSQGSGGGQGSRSETGARVTETVMVNQITYQQHYGALVPHPDIIEPGINPSNQLADGFFNLDTDCMIQNFSALPQGFAGITHSQFSSRPLSFESVYVHNQTNSKAASMDSGSQWTGSENSNFCSGDSQTKPN